jgi:hypothetical protein
VITFFLMDLGLVRITMSWQLSWVDDELQF